MIKNANIQRTFDMGANKIATGDMRIKGSFCSNTSRIDSDSVG